MSTVSIKAVVLKHRPNLEKCFNIKLRITFKRESRYLPTSQTVSPSQLNGKLEIKNPALKAKLAGMIADMHSHIGKIDSFALQDMDVDGVVAFIKKSMAAESETFVLDFFSFGADVAASKPKYSGNNYRTALNSFASFLGRNTVDISEITSSMMRRYEAFLTEKYGRDARAVSLYTSSIAAIHAEARKRYNDNETGVLLIRNPFEFYTPPKQKPAQKRTVTAETIQKLIDIRRELHDLDRLAVDVFLLSFCLMGTNVPDIYAATKEGDVIHYNRTKTQGRRYDKAEMFIRCEPVAKILFDDYADPSEERAFNLYRRYTFYKSIADKGNDRLKVVAEMIGEKPFTMYAARHTWATIAYSAGISKGLINDCLCHVDPSMSVTDIYIKKDWSILWEANRKVLGMFDWSRL